MTTAPEAASILDLHMEIEIDGSPEKVWQALTDDIGAWWPEDGYAGGKTGRRRYALEAKPGGRMYESWDDGGGLLWGTVVTIEPGRMLQVIGHTFPNWGGPATWFATWSLEGDGSSTVLTFSESTVGLISAVTAEQKEGGWKFLFEGALKSYVEGRPAPAWEE